MNVVRYLFSLLAVAALLALVGCNGSAPGLDPTVTFTFPDGTNLPFLSAGTVLVIKGAATLADATSNPITDIQWTQNPAIGTFSSTSMLETTWRITDPTSITAHTEVTLTVTVKTLEGGKRTSSIHLIILPLGEGDLLVPVVSWDPTAMNAENPSNISLPNIVGGTAMLIKGTVTSLDASNLITGYSWSAINNTSGGTTAADIGTFNVPSIFGATWTAPTVATPQDITLMLTITTVKGGASQHTLDVTVNP